MSVQKSGSRMEKERARFKRYKEDVAREGKPFFPNAVFHDSLMALVVVATIIVLTVIWKVTSHGTDPGWLGPLYDNKADPGTTSFVPRPDWYFYFLFYLLRIFKWPDTVVLGTVIVPNILLVLLILLPFYDKRMERRPSRRPVAMIAFVLTIVSMGLLTYKGATAKESLASEAVTNVPNWVAKNKLPKATWAGARLFAESSCLNCHTYLGAGSSNLGAPDLSAIGTKNLGADFFAGYIADPSKYGNNIMPHFAELGQANLQALGAFLDASRGGQAAPAPTPTLKGDPAAGKKVFATAGCVGCHTLKDAGAVGQVGPNLDQMKPAASLVVSFVTNGSPSGKMPPFKSSLNAQQIADVAAYVSSVAGK